jgi:hypothetical protein
MSIILVLASAAVFCFLLTSISLLLILAAFYFYLKTPSARAAMLTPDYHVSPPVTEIQRPIRGVPLKGKPRPHRLPSIPEETPHQVMWESFTVPLKPQAPPRQIQETTDAKMILSGEPPSMPSIPEETMEDIHLENFQWLAPKKLRPRWMPSITAEINPRQIIWTSFEAEAPKPLENPVPVAATMPMPPPDEYYDVRINNNQLNSSSSGEPVVAVLVPAVLCEETASSTSTSTCDSTDSGSTTEHCYYPTTLENECLLAVQPTPILKITGGKYKGKMCTVVRPTAKMVEIQILGDTRTRRIMKTSLLWDKVAGPFKPCP